MAKETFDRSKPHVNIGNTAILNDTSGSLTASDAASSTVGSGDTDSSILMFDASSSLSNETASVAFPIDTFFVFDPSSSGDAVSIDFQLEILPTTVAGTSSVDVAFTIIQDEPFVASRAAGSIDGTETDWTSIGQSGLRLEDFQAVDGGPERPDFGRPFQFGYAFTGEYSTSALSVQLGIDNMHVEITTVPEPTSIALAVAMGISLWWNRWWCASDDEPSN